ncbi:MAG: Rieske 2Fe-2S domain-containing protein [Gammaproteobacteria bacterium]|nr:Rieske 2Fe-2S domain-containing protein [Gammaproteobacteria bacterium]
MSDALTYLMKIRPDAMHSYFDFIKKSGKHLDKKTRAIISVLTKVDNQTDTGFRQYLVRALQAGVTPDEIIDSLLIAFPTLGLSKIIWAIDIIIDMNIPEFQPDKLGNDQKWHAVIAISEIVEGVSRHDCDSRELFIYQDGDFIKVYDSRCPHQATNIPVSALAGNTLTCPRHHWKFDITTGKCIENGTRPLNQLNTKVENEMLYAYW